MLWLGRGWPHSWRPPPKPWNQCARTIARRGAKRRRVEISVKRRLEKGQHSNTYLVSPLLMDLVAEGSPGARECDLQDEKALLELGRRQSSVGPLVERMNTLKREAKEASQLWNEQLKNFDPRLITSRDIFEVALLGTPSKESADVLQVPNESETRKTHATQEVKSPSTFLDQHVLKSMGISEQITQKDEYTLRILIQRYNQQPRKVVDLSLVGELKKQIAESDFALMRRLVGPLLQTEAGCQLVAECGSEIFKSLVKRSDFFEAAEEAMAFLRSIATNLAERNMLPPGLASPIRLVHEGVSDDLDPVTAIAHVVLLQDQSAIGGLLALLSPKTIRKGHLFALLIKKGDRDDGRQATMGDTLRSDITSSSDSYSRFITLLGQIGAIRTLCHEWHCLDEPIRGGWRAPFATAIAQAMAIIQVQRVVPDKRVYFEATGNREEDMKLDLDMIKFTENLEGLLRPESVRPQIASSVLGKGIAKALARSDPLYMLESLSVLPYEGLPVGGQ